MIHQTLWEVRDGKWVRVRLRNDLFKTRGGCDAEGSGCDQGAKHINRTCQQCPIEAETGECAGGCGNTEERPLSSWRSGESFWGKLGARLEGRVKAGQDKKDRKSIGAGGGGGCLRENTDA